MFSSLVQISSLGGEACIGIFSPKSAKKRIHEVLKSCVDTNCKSQFTDRLINHPSLLVVET